MNITDLLRRKTAKSTFVQAAGLTDPTHISAVNQLETDLKSNNLWDKMIAVYPFVGGTAHAHKFNLIDPRDADAAFRLTITGGVNDSAGHKISTTSIKTNCIASGYFYDNTNAHISMYSSSIPTNLFVGCHHSDPVSFRLMNSTIYHADIIGSFANGRVQSTQITDVAGFLVGSRTSNTNATLWRKGSKLATSSQTNVNGSAPDKVIEISGNDVVVSFTSIGFGLTDAEVTALNTIVQDYQTTLSRKIT
jgi:hypothetical protein